MYFRVLTSALSYPTSDEYIVEMKFFASSPTKVELVIFSPSENAFEYPSSFTAFCTSLSDTAITLINAVVAALLLRAVICACVSGAMPRNGKLKDSCE